MPENCLFCNIVKGLVPSYKIAENNKVLVFLDIYPQTKGHTLVIPKSHSVNILDTPDQEVEVVYKMVKKVCLALKKSLKVNDFLVKSHNGVLAGQEIGHFHVHIIPCYDSSCKNKKREEGKEEHLRRLQKTISSHLD